MSSQVIPNEVLQFSASALSVPAPQRGSSGPGLRVVSFGGGTGLSNLLRGLKQHLLPLTGVVDARRTAIEQLSAVVAVTDDGGSSGRIRSEFNLLPPGDIRNCLVALADDEAVLSRMFQYRFANGGELEGHSFGNLFLTVLAQLTDDFVEAVRLASGILGTRGRILPASTIPAQLGAEMRDGSFVIGESAITQSHAGVRRVQLLPAEVPAVPETLQAIAEADIITVGPGSLFTSLVPNLLVPGIAEAVATSRAFKIYICNLMTQPNETLGMTATDHVTALHAHAGRSLFDAILVNRAPIPAELIATYAAEGAAPVSYNHAELEAMGLQIIEGDYLHPFASRKNSQCRSKRDAEKLLARHDTNAIARDLIAFAARRVVDAETALAA